jgi:hypothetical protein
MEGERIVSPTTTRYGLREGVAGERAEDNNLFSDDDEEFSRKWSFSSSVDPGSPEQILSVYSSNTLDYSIEQNDDDTLFELLHKINDESGNSKGGVNKSKIFLFDDNNNNNNNSNSTAIGTNIGYSTNNNNSTSRIIHDATSSPPPSHRLEYGMNSHISSAVPLVTPPGLTRTTTDCRSSAQNNNQQSTITTKSTLTTSSSNQNNNKVEDEDRTFVEGDKDVVGGGCGICLGLSETVNNTLSNMTDMLMDYIGNNNTIIDSACTDWKKNVPGGAAAAAGAAMQYTNYESSAQKQARLRTERHTAWKHCFEDE